jgi:SAM-dependent methyltransferase
MRDMVFDAYARYYDLLYRDKDYAAEAQYVASCIRRHAPQAKRVLELGCGTGAHAEHLAREGYVVHGVDLSEAMLARAEERRSHVSTEIAKRWTFRRDDVRTVRTGETYDAVIALFHVMSYQTTNADLAAAFATAAVHLKRGGLFVFDFWYGPAVLTQTPEVRVKRLSDDHINVTRIAEPVMHMNDNVVDVHYAVFIELKATGKVEQLQETHRMRYLSLPELALLRRDLFEEHATLAWMSDTPPSTQSWSAFQILFRISS